MKTNAPDTLPSLRAAASIALAVDGNGDESTIELSDSELASITGGCAACGNPYHQPQRQMPPPMMNTMGGAAPPPPGMGGMPGFGGGEL